MVDMSHDSKFKQEITNILIKFSSCQSFDSYKLSVLQTSLVNLSITPFSNQIFYKVQPKRKWNRHVRLFRNFSYVLGWTYKYDLLGARTRAEIVCCGLEVTQSEILPWRVEIADVGIKPKVKMQSLSHTVTQSFGELEYTKRMQFTYGVAGFWPQ